MGDAFNEYLKFSHELEQKMIAAMGEEEYFASEHWINNPLINNISKLDMFNKAMAQAWEEGYAQGSADSYDSRLDADNPYLQG